MHPVLELLIPLSLAMLGALCIQLLIPGAGRLETVALCFPLGGGLFTFLAFLCSWVGIRLGSLTFVVLWMAAAGSAAALLLRRQHSGPRARSETEQGGGPADALESARSRLPLAVGVVGVSVLALGAAFISVGRAHSNWDTAAMWVVKGYGIAEEGSIFGGEIWGGHGLAYPLNIQLLVSMFRLATGDQMPGSQLIFALFYASTPLALLAFWLRSGVRTGMAAAGALFAATIPVVFLHGTIGFVNLPVAYYVAIGSLYILYGLRTRHRSALVLGGILLGLASWTILEGFLYAGAAALTIAVLHKTSRDSIASDDRAWMLPFGAITATWLVFYLIYGVNGSQAEGVVRQMFESFQAGDFNLTELRLIFGYTRRYLFDPSIWGLLFPLGGVLALIGVRAAAADQLGQAFAALMLFLVTALLTGALFYLRSFVPIDLLAWLMRGFPRTFLTSAIFFTATIVLIAARSASSRPVAGLSAG